jgi:hypothetical protein
VEPLTGLHSTGNLLTLPKNIKLWCKYVAVANTLDYYDVTTIMAVKGFIVQAQGANIAAYLTVK